MPVQGVAQGAVAAVVRQTPTTPSAATPVPEPRPPETYSYNPDGRRDPFVSLLLRGSDLQSNARRPLGLAGLAVGEVALRGIVRHEGTFVAILQGPDNKTYLVHAGDRLFDGTVKAITGDAVVFIQEVNDPLSLIKQREVRKPLRPSPEDR